MVQRGSQETGKGSGGDSGKVGVDILAEVVWMSRSTNIYENVSIAVILTGMAWIGHHVYGTDGFVSFPMFSVSLILVMMICSFINLLKYMGGLDEVVLSGESNPILEISRFIIICVVGTLCMGSILNHIFRVNQGSSILAAITTGGIAISFAVPMSRKMSSGAWMMNFALVFMLISCAIVTDPAVSFIDGVAVAIGSAVLVGWLVGSIRRQESRIPVARDHASPSSSGKKDVESIGTIVLDKASVSSGTCCICGESANFVCPVCGAAEHEECIVFNERKCGRFGCAWKMPSPVSARRPASVCPERHEQIVTPHLACSSNLVEKLLAFENQVEEPRKSPIEMRERAINLVQYIRCVLRDEINRRKEILR